MLAKNKDTSLESSTFKSIFGVIALYGLGVGAVKSFRDFRKAFGELRQELKKKEPEATYKQRVITKIWPCVKHAAAFVAYTASMLGIAIGLIITFGPGLGISAGVITTISVVAISAASISTLAEKLADKKITSATAALAQMQEHMGESKGPSLSDHKYVKRIKELGTHFQAAREIHNEYHQHKGKKADFLMKKADEHRDVLLKATHHIAGPEYEKIAKSTLQSLDVLRENPLYQHITYSPEMIHKDPQGLLVKVAEDYIKRFKNHKGVQIHMNANPSDEALRLAMATVAQGLGPLKMKPGKNIKSILKALEAAKLADPEVHLRIDSSDRKRIEEGPKETRDYFEALVEVNATKFKDYVAEHVDRKLGQIPEEIPTDWKPSPRYTKD